MATQWTKCEAQPGPELDEGWRSRSRWSESKTIEQCATFAIQMQLRVIIDSVSTQVKTHNQIVKKTKEKNLKNKLKKEK